MELILVSGLGTFVLLAAQMLDYLRETPHQPVIGHVIPMTAAEPSQVPAGSTTEVAAQYDQAA
jgi:hypothetical protein